MKLVGLSAMIALAFANDAKLFQDNVARSVDTGIIMTKNERTDKATVIYKRSVTNVARGDTLEVLAQTVVSRCNEGDVEGVHDDQPCYLNRGKRGCESSYDPWLRFAVFVDSPDGVRHMGSWTSLKCEKEMHHCTLNAESLTLTAGSDLTGDLKIGLLVSADSNGQALECDTDLVRIDDKGYVAAVVNSGGSPESFANHISDPGAKYYAQDACADNKEECDRIKVAEVPVKRWSPGQVINADGFLDMHLTNPHDTCSPSVVLYFTLEDAGRPVADLGEKSNQNCEYNNPNCHFEKKAAFELPSGLELSSQRALLSPRKAGTDLYVAMSASAAKHPCVNEGTDKWMADAGKLTVRVFNGLGSVANNTTSVSV